MSLVDPWFTDYRISNDPMLTLAELNRRDAKLDKEHRDMAKRYTAADFANARFAEHEDGRVAMKSSGYAMWDVKFLDGHISTRDDYHMASFGWVPVPAKPTITRRRYDAISKLDPADYGHGFRAAMKEFGIEIVPDQEPTNRELIADALAAGFDGAEFTLTSPFSIIAASLATRGITAPNVKDN